MQLGMIGFGPLATEALKFLAEAHQEIDQLTVFDDTVAGPDGSLQYPFSDWREQKDELDTFFIALGYRHLGLKGKLIQEIIGFNMTLLRVAHPQAYVGTEEIGAGTLIYPLVYLGPRCKIGMGVVVHNSSSIAHDTTIGDCSFIASNVTICGNVEIGKRTFIGSGSTIVDGVRIGDDCKIGAGSLVQHNLNSGQCAVGNPARIVDQLVL